MNLDLSPWSTRRKIVAGIALVAVIGALYVGYSAIRAWVAWRSIDRVEFDLEASRAALGLTTSTTLPPASGESVDYLSFLAIGSDQKPPEKQTGVYADAVLLYLDPSDADPMLISFPRDLLVTDPCTGDTVKLNSLLEGCADSVSGPELLAIVIEDFTGIPVDHFGVIGFEGLVSAIDGLGGVRLCVPHALRQGTSEILPEGCSVADGQTVLKFVRTRTAEEFVNGEWRYIKGESDLTRAARQQQVLFALLNRAKQLRDPGDLASLVTDMGDALVLDDSLSMGQAIGLAWDLRATPAETIRRIVLPVESVVTEDGSYAVVATTPFADVISPPSD